MDTCKIYSLAGGMQAGDRTSGNRPQPRSTTHAAALNNVVLIPNSMHIQTTLSQNFDRTLVQQK